MVKKICLSIAAVFAACAALSAHASSVPLNAVSAASIQAASATATAAAPAASTPVSAPDAATVNAAKPVLFIPGEYEGNLAQRIADNLSESSWRIELRNANWSSAHRRRLAAGSSKAWPLGMGRVFMAA